MPTITEKILAAHCHKKQVSPGDLINADLDIVMCHDITTPPAIRMLQENKIDHIFDANKIVVIPDHFVPNKDIKSAELAQRLRVWVKKHHLKNYFEVGRSGVCHALLPEQGYVLPGTTIVCGDSHTCTHGALGAFATGVGSTDLAFGLATGKLWFKVPPSLKFILKGKLPKGVFAKDVILEIIHQIGVDGALYKAMEFTGDIIDELEIDDRMTICNMAIEAGAKSGIINPDQKTVHYVKSKTNKQFPVFKSDKNAEYEQIITINCSKLTPIIAFPHLPSNCKKITDIKNEIKIDQAFLGSCTNGRINDLRIAAKILKNNRIAPSVRMIVIPATTKIWQQASKEGLFDVFTKAGAFVSGPTCGPCLGGHLGILAKGEKCISTSNRNFVGRMGHPESEVYLASPATVAASAIKGKIADCRNYL